MTKKKATRGDVKRHHDFLTYPSRKDHPTAVAYEKEQIGDRIKRAREARGLTIQNLSRLTRIDQDALQRIESNEIIPPLGELVRLGKALETKMGDFISPAADKSVTIVRAHERRQVFRYGGGKKEKSGYSYESLAAEKANRSMEPFLVTLKPTENEEPSAHDGQEFLFVLEGEMSARVGDRTDILGPGDAIYYDSSQPHLVKCMGSSETRILAVLYTERE